MLTKARLVNSPWVIGRPIFNVKNSSPYQGGEERRKGKYRMAQSIDIMAPPRKRSFRFDRINCPLGEMRVLLIDYFKRP